MVAAFRRSFSPGATRRKLAVGWREIVTSTPASVLSTICRSAGSILLTTPTVFVAACCAHAVKPHSAASTHAKRQFIMLVILLQNFASERLSTDFREQVYLFAPAGNRLLATIKTG